VAVLWSLVEWCCGSGVEWCGVVWVWSGVESYGVELSLDIISHIVIIFDS